MNVSNLIKKIKLEYSIRGIRKYSNENSYHSMIGTDFKAFKTLVSLGDYALPYLNNLIGNDKEPRWHIISACNQILKNNNSDFEFPEEIRGKCSKMEEHLKKYLENYLKN
jgi:hypothetical protein